MVLKFSVSKQEKASGKMAGEIKCNHGRMNFISKKIFPMYMISIVKVGLFLEGR